VKAQIHESDPTGLRNSSKFISSKMNAYGSSTALKLGTALIFDFAGGEPAIACTSLVHTSVLCIHKYFYLSRLGVMMQV